jgi:hypothetical protein
MYSGHEDISKEISDEMIDDAIRDSKSYELQLNGSIEPIRILLNQVLKNLKEPPIFMLEKIHREMIKVCQDIVESIVQ